MLGHGVTLYNIIQVLLAYTTIRSYTNLQLRSSSASLGLSGMMVYNETLVHGIIHSIIFLFYITMTNC